MLAASTCGTPAACCGTLYTVSDGYSCTGKLFNAFSVETREQHWELYKHYSNDTGKAWNPVTKVTAYRTGQTLLSLMCLTKLYNVLRIYPQYILHKKHEPHGSMLEWMVCKDCKLKDSNGAHLSCRQFAYFALIIWSTIYTRLQQPSYASSTGR